MQGLVLALQLEITLMRMQMVCFHPPRALGLPYRREEHLPHSGAPAPELLLLFLLVPWVVDSVHPVQCQQTPSHLCRTPRLHPVA